MLSLTPVGCRDDRSAPSGMPAIRSTLADAGTPTKRTSTIHQQTLTNIERQIATELAQRFFIGQMATRQDEECCSDPGAIADCWWQDAERDGVVCVTNSDCDGGNVCDKDINAGDLKPPNSWGLCTCTDDSECGEGICHNGLCGPSFCNGYLVCSCWGGCTEANMGSYETPNDMCTDVEAGAPGECCESNYPAAADGSRNGFCSDDCGGGGGGQVGEGSPCTIDADCVDPLPDPYSADCIRYLCDAGACRLDYINDNISCSDNVRKTDAGYWGDAVRNEGSGILSCFEGRCDAVGKCLSFAAANGLACDDDDSSPCTEEMCLDGVCDHDFTGHVGDPCNGDGNACSLDECNGTGLCVIGPAKDCNDDNWCTYPDTCEDLDANHVLATCDNPAEDGNAEAFGYSDAVECGDLICVSGFETSEVTDCTAYNPIGYDLQCNAFACENGNGEDNCTITYGATLGNVCSDQDACTIGDRCVDAGDHGECQPTGLLDCDDLNPCTMDTCTAGTCVNTADEGAACSDGNPCTLSDICDETGSCVPGAPKSCSGLSDACTNGVCNTGTGACEAHYLDMGTLCDADGNPCTVNDSCDGAGQCMTGAAKSCASQSDQCNTGVCDTGTGDCKADPAPHEGDSCNADDDACTPIDTCQAGVCVADLSPISCTASNDQCNISACDAATGVCEYYNAALGGDPCNSDNNGCTSETCQGDPAGDQALTCTVTASVTCSDGNPCTGDTCVSTGNFIHTCDHPNLPNTTACNLDTNGCTADDHCNGLGTCVAGDAVSASDCEAELIAALPAFDTDCNTAICVSSGANAYDCQAVAKATSPGDCSADDDGCTLDYCNSFSPVTGAVCTVGGAPSCTPSDSCHTAACESTGDLSYTCDQTLKPGCCDIEADCLGQGYACEGGGVCNDLVCNAGHCGCAVAAVGTDCTDDLDVGLYPENCYEGACNASAVCAASSIALTDVENNLCSDLFDPGDPTALDTANAGYLGALDQANDDGDSLFATGSTLCGDNNYKALAENDCEEAAGGADLGESGHDMAYAFGYQTEPAGSAEQYAYVVKVEADYDAAVYAQNDVTEAANCPEGNNPDDDAAGECSGSLSVEFWTGVSGDYVTDINLAAPTAGTGTITSFQTPFNQGDHYGERIRGYITAPFTGSYTFWIVSDDNSELWISTDDTVANKVKRAEVKYVKNICAGYVLPGLWNKCPSQKSSPVSLVAGQKYYVEVLHVDSFMGDNLEVGWAKPGESTVTPSEIIPGSVISPWDGGGSGGGGGGSSTPVARLGSWTSNAGSTTLSYGAAPAGSNRFMVVGIQIEHTVGAVTISDVTYGGQSGTRLSTQDPGGYQLVELWTFDETDIAAQLGGMISITSTGTKNGITIHAGMYGNVYQTTPVAEVQDDNVNASTPNPITTVDIAAAAGSVVVSFTGSGQDSTAIWAAGLTEQTDRKGNSTAGSAADTLVAAAGTVPCRATWALQNRAAQWSVELSPVPSTPDDPASCINEVPWSCTHPYADSPMPEVIEESCDDSGNTLNGQTCCDPCIDGADCGYKWCERGYSDDGGDCDLCSGPDPDLGSCDAVWTYPNDIYGCTAKRPGDASYAGFTNIATTVIYPSANDGLWKNAVIYVDGSNGEEGHFYVTVEKHLLRQSPCERANDDTRIADVTDVGVSGETFNGSVEGLANSDHADPSPVSDTDCGGFDCDSVWTGDSSCHDSGASANQFWPAEAYYQIYREAAEGSATYCLTAAPAGTHPLNAVLAIEKAPGATDICFEDYDDVSCAHGNYQGTGARIELNALAEVQYLIGVSRYEGLNRPCINASGDNCDFNLKVQRGSCPTACVDVAEWYSGYVQPAAATVNGATFPTTYTHPFVGEHYVHLMEGDNTKRHNNFNLENGWNSKDEVWRLDFTGTAPAMVHFSGCSFGGYGSFDGRVALLDCRGNMLKTDDDGCGLGGMPAFSYLMDPDDDPYYLVVDGDKGMDKSEYGIAVYYAATCADGLQNGSETGVDCGGPGCPACAPTCSDAIKNGTETGVDCGGTCPACVCGAGTCRYNQDCSGGVPWCDKAVLDGNGCGVCRTYFVQCNTTDPNTQLDLDATDGTMFTAPMNMGCINLDTTNHAADFANVQDDNRTIKLQNLSPALAGTCTFPYLLAYTTTYCVSVDGVDTIDQDELAIDDVISDCDEMGSIRGTYTMDSWWDEIQIPLRRYAMSLDIQFQGSDDCVMDMAVWYDDIWSAPPAPSTIYCPTEYGSGVTCDPNPPKLP